MKKNYIGIANTFHDSSIAIVNSEGEVVFAEATERYLQNKRAINNVPDQFVRIGKLVQKNCEPGADLVVAHSWSSETEKRLEFAKELLNKEDNIWKNNSGDVPSFIKDKLIFREFVIASQISAINMANKTLKYELSQIKDWCTKADFTIRNYDHHLTHAATACYTSPYSEGVCAILDGYGEYGAHHSYTYKDGKITSLDKDRDQNFLSTSLGIFYMTICDVCGFGYFKGQEWKVMGLAAYGKFDQKYYDILRPMLKVKGLSIQSCSFLKYNQNLRKLYSYKRNSHESPLKIADLAYTGQIVFCEILYEYLNNLYDVMPSDNIILGGGCMLNSWANGGINEKTKFKNSYIFSAPGDDGNSIGAALLAYYEDNPRKKHINKFQTPYLGSEMSEDAIEKLKRFGGLGKLLKTYPGDIHKKAAELLSEGKIIGWIQGRAEFGPRALGNRSILADPRSPGCKDAINSKVKFREEFRPFAPIILHECGHEYFLNYQETPYMERTLRYRDDVMDKVPSVVHENLTGRLQTVKKEWNEKFYLLLKEFYNITGSPVLLNTSFNVMGKPIIHSVEDALAVFFTSGLDALIIDDILIQKPLDIL